MFSVCIACSMTEKITKDWKSAHSSLLGTAQGPRNERGRICDVSDTAYVFSSHVVLQPSVFIPPSSKLEVYCLQL